MVLFLSPYRMPMVLSTRHRTRRLRNWAAKQTDLINGKKLGAYTNPLSVDANWGNRDIRLHATRPMSPQDRTWNS